jgi:hypothetical protein
MTRNVSQCKRKIDPVQCTSHFMPSLSAGGLLSVWEEPAPFSNRIPCRSYAVSGRGEVRDLNRDLVSLGRITRFEA